MARKPLYQSRAKTAPTGQTTGKDTPEQKCAKRWAEEIDRYNRGSQKWRERSGKIERIYLDEDRGSNDEDRRFAILWANVETMKPATYARRPQAVVSRRWETDDAGRKACEVLERCINTTFDLGGINEVMEGVRDDRLIAARGTAWVRYEADFEDIENEQPDPDGNMPQRVTGERVINEFVHWADFGHSLARTWPEVTLVWRVVYMTREKVEARKFKNKDAVSRLRYEVRPELAERTGTNGEADAYEPQCRIYECWDKSKGRVGWLNKDDVDGMLELGPPPLDFRDFWPCPKPVYGTRSTRSLIPIPDYRYYQDQADEIQDLTAKISSLTGWLRMKGFLPAGPSAEGGDALQQLLKLETTLRSQGDAILVPVESWSGFTEKGGATKLIDWLPIDQVVVALREAIQSRREVKNDVYELTGISDILRGETDPNETLGAQQIKAQTGSRRISTVQRDLARFARDLADLNGMVIGGVFSDQTMSEMSGIDLTTRPPPEMMARYAMLKLQAQQAMMPAQPGMMTPSSPGAPASQNMQAEMAAIEQQFQEYDLNRQVLSILRDEDMMGFRIDVETDSTIEPDEQAEKQQAIEFLGAVGQFMTAALPVLQAQPKMLPIMSEMFQFLVRRFRAGRSLEDVVERTMKELKAAAAQPPMPPPPDPRAIKAQSDAQLGAAQLQQEGQLEVRKQNMEFATKQREQDLKAATAVHQTRSDAAIAALEALNNAQQPMQPNGGITTQ